MSHPTVGQELQEEHRLLLQREDLYLAGGFLIVHALNGLGSVPDGLKMNTEV